MLEKNGIEFAGLLSVSQDIASRTISAVDVTTALIERIEQIEPSIGAFASLCVDEALAAAAQADREIAQGLHRGPLHGIPIALKDLIATRGHVTASGMTLFADRRPDEDATAVARLRLAGAVVIGKTKTTEAATLAHHPNIPAPRNPWSREHCSGFSSSGSGAAVAAGLCFAALGSDTGGSIRIPSAMNGVTGLKPSWGRVSRHGVFPLAEYFDVIGPMARNAADLAAVLGVIAGPDRRDPTAAAIPVPDYLGHIDEGISGIAIGIDFDAWETCCDNQIFAVIKEAAEVLADLGALVRPVSMPEFDQTKILPLILAGAAEAHRATYPEMREFYGPGLSAMLDHAAKLKAADFSASLNYANALRGRLATLFTGIDLLLAPVLTGPVPLAGVLEAALPGEAPMDLLRFNPPFSVSGQPTITLCGGADKDGLPIGFQLAARPFEEALLLRAGHAFQQATTWHVRHPSPR